MRAEHPGLAGEDGEWFGGRAAEAQSWSGDFAGAAGRVSGGGYIHHCCGRGRYIKTEVG